MPDTTTGTFVRTNGDRAIVQLDDGSELALRIVGSYMPQPGDTVRITRDGAATLVDGLATPREPVGTILALDERVDGSGVARLVARVRTADDKVQDDVEILDHVTAPTVGDSVVVLAGFIIGRRSAPITN